MSTIRGFRSLIIVLALISVAVNFLLLASPLYMLQVFDRVLSGRSLETLLFLSIIVFAALLVMGGFDGCRALILARLGDWLDRRLGGELLEASVDLAARPSAKATSQPINDLSAVRQFLSSPGVGALFDAPWIPFFIAVIWLLHPLLGTVAIGSALLLAGLGVLGEIATRRATEQAGEAGAESHGLLETALANADVLRSMGLMEGLRARWGSMRDLQSTHILRTTSLLGVLSVSSKALRLAVQSAILGTGAYLVLSRDISPGEMIAASIILSRALAPVEVAISSWRQFVSARTAWRRITNLLRHHAQRPRGLPLPAPKAQLELDKVVLQTAPGADPVLRNVSFTLPAGEVLGIVGPSASGKSSLGRLLVGAWQPTSGTVRLDGAELDHWDRATLGRYVGYLPQQVDLFPGSVADNIARFGEASLDHVIAAAELAGASEMIRSLPRGYESQVGSRGERFSGGQRQRIALARAVYGDPRLVVLDEPDSNLDQAGHDGLVQCIDALKKRGMSVVVIAHRRNLLACCDKLLLLQNGQMMACGPTRHVVEHLDGKGRTPLRAVSGEAEKE